MKDGTCWRYAYMCRMDHTQIGHSDSSSEECPMCRDKATIRELVEALKDAQSVLWMAEKWADGGSAIERESVSEVVGKVRKALTNEGRG